MFNRFPILVSFRLALLSLLLAVDVAQAVTGVHPTGVNVNATAPTSVFLTFQGLNNTETTVESFWCGELIAPNSPIVTATNPCRSDTLFGFLPQRNNLTRNSGTGSASNLTDIMTIPTSVSRRAYQAAQQGEDATFFYVRHFVDGAVDTYVRVTCRMTGGGARVPLALTDVRLGFQGQGSEFAIIYLNGDDPLPHFGAQLRYNGSGELRGRWELVQPGDSEPESFDLLPESSLPIELRGSQKRYTLLDRFSVFLQPSGVHFLPGPDPAALPRVANGNYKILLRIESSNDREGNSDTGAGVVSSGGVAGFAMPVLRFVQTGGTGSQGITGLTLLTPPTEAELTIGQLPLFTWTIISGARHYRFEIKDGGDVPFVAIVDGTTTYYRPPPFLGTDSVSDMPHAWRVLALGANGEELARSDWRPIRLLP
ncbi:MAG: hypothetical protein P8Z77_01030 [Candidatus Thiodiazotropha sp.]